MTIRPFNSHLVLEERISEATLRAYDVGFDQNRFRLEPLVNVICEVIPEFVYGFYRGSSTPDTAIVSRLREAAHRVYTTDKYGSRGEFGELILHLLLRDFCGTIPLISKIYFKDADNVTVHGFDGVHIVIQESQKELWLGESKIYTDGSAGVTELATDLAKHLERDYLRREFSLISTKIPDSIPEIEYWRELLHENQRLESILQTVCIPMLCTFTSPLYAKHKDNTAEYLSEFISECRCLKAVFDGKKIETDVNVILMLVPVESKDQLIEKLDHRLKSMQSI
jgi:HamA